MHREMDVFGIHSSGISGNQIVSPCMGDLDHFSDSFGLAKVSRV
jgi:hypothetical protein